MTDPVVPLPEQHNEDEQRLWDSLDGYADNAPTDAEQADLDYGSDD